MLTDRFGGRHSSADGSAVAAYEDAVLGIVSHRPTVTPALQLALAADPGFTAAHALKGLAAVILAREELLAPARAALAEAEAARVAHGGCTSSERTLISALGEAVDGRLIAAADLVDAHWRGRTLRPARDQAQPCLALHAGRFPQVCSPPPRPCCRPGTHRCRATAFSRGVMRSASRSAASCVPPSWPATWRSSTSPRTPGRCTPSPMCTRPRAATSMASAGWREPGRSGRAATTCRSTWPGTWRCSMSSSSATSGAGDLRRRGPPAADRRFSRHGQRRLAALAAAPGGRRGRPSLGRAARHRATPAGRHTLMFASLHYLMALVATGEIAAAHELVAAIAARGLSGQGDQARVAAQVGLGLAKAILGIADRRCRTQGARPARQGDAAARRQPHPARRVRPHAGPARRRPGRPRRPGPDPGPAHAARAR